jgi:hypothetical protein
MDELNELEKQVRAKMALVAEGHRTGEGMREESAQRRMECERAGQELMLAVIRPRIERVVAFFPNALRFPQGSATDLQWCCRFRKTEDYPASIKLSLLVSPDAELRNVIVTYDLRILPIYFEFQGHDQLAVPIDRVRDASVAAWVAAKLLQFVDASLLTRTLDLHGLSTAVTEPSGNALHDLNSPAGPTARSSERGRDVDALGKSEISWHEDQQRQFAMNRPEYD